MTRQESTIPEVSVVVPTRNRREMLRRTLVTILGQVEVSIEVIVVDEASDDGTVEMVRSIGDPRIRVVQHEVARGLPSARNSGIAAARAPWIAFCDDDDMWAPDKLAAQLRSLARSPQAAWSVCGAIWVDTGLRLVRAFHTPPAGDIADAVLAFNALPGSASSVMVRSSVLHEIGPFDTSLRWGEDWDMWTRFALTSPIATVDRPLVAILVHDRNMSSHSPKFGRDAARIEQKYRAARRARHVRIDTAHLLGAQAEADLKAGRRGRAALQYARQVRHGGGLGAIRRSAAALLVPTAMGAWRSRRRRASIPASWADEAERWLAPLRRSGRCPEEGSRALGTSQPELGTWGGREGSSTP